MRKYYSIAGQTVAMDDGDGLKYFLTDHLGSVLAVVDDAGAVLSEQRYLPFGQVREDVGTVTETDFGYTFQRHNSYIKLYDYRSRWLDPGLGRFTQPDSIVPDLNNPQLLNRYAYVNNSPINYSDPSGHDPAGTCSGNPYCMSYVEVRPWLDSARKSGACAGMSGVVLGICNTNDRAAEHRSEELEERRVAFEEDYSKTVSYRAGRGDFWAILDLVIPTQFGWREQFELCPLKPVIAACGTAGLNHVYNRTSDQFVQFVDVSVTTGPGAGTGASLTTGPLFGWFSKDNKNLTEGISGQLAVGGAYGYAGAYSSSVSSKMDEKYGQLPVVHYVGGGVGGPGYVSGGVGATGAIWSVDSSWMIPWHWFR